MTKKKSIVEQALLQVEELEDAVKQNAKGILASTMKQELNELLKEEKEEDEDIVPDEEDEKDVPDDGDEESSITDEMPDDLSTEGPDEESLLDDEDLEDEDLEDEGFEDEGFEDEDLEDDDEVLDMTGASPEEVAKVFKAMEPDDGIIVKKDDNKLEINVEEPGEYIIDLNEQVEESDETNDISMENIYEIEIDDVDDDLDTSEFGDDEEIVTGEVDEDKNDPFTKTPGKGSGKKGDPFVKDEGEPVKNPKLPLTKPENKQKGGGPKTDPYNKNKKVTRGEQTEAARVKTNPHGDKNKAQSRTGIKGKKVYKAGSLNEQVKSLKKQNEEYKKALVLFKDKLNEVAVFNANLAYATRLFTEHTTTKKEKMNILKRFDSVSTIKESKNLYGQIKEELDSKAPITETVANEISKSNKTSSSSKLLSETKLYENEQFSRMKELMKF